jgi:hypothetical protein
MAGRVGGFDQHDCLDHQLKHGQFAGSILTLVNL